MPLTVPCLKCKAKFQVPSKLAGTTVRCQACGFMLRLPSPEKILAKKLAPAKAGKAGPNKPATAAAQAGAATGRGGIRRRIFRAAVRPGQRRPSPPRRRAHPSRRSCRAAIVRACCITIPTSPTRRWRARTAATTWSCPSFNMPHDVITFGEAMIRLAPPDFRRLEQAAQPRPPGRRRRAEHRRRRWPVWAVRPPGCRG